MATRTQDEILARIAELNDQPDLDFWGFRFEVLVYALDYEHAKAHLQSGVTEEAWNESSQATGIAKEAQNYYDFALSKIEDHRGLSAQRSVEKLEEYAWILGLDDVVTAMREAEYAQYGAPKIKAFADGVEGCSWPEDNELLNHMAQGLPCEEGCEAGCDL